MQATVLVGVKLPGRTLMATGVAGPDQHSRLFYVVDKNTGTRFLVDTGSEVSVLPPSLSDQKHSPDKLTLTAVNNTSITTYGKRSLTLNLGLRRSFPWIFIIADIQKPIIGADFLRHFGLLVDMRQHQLTDTATQLFVQGILSPEVSPSPSILPKQPDNIYLKLVSEFPALTQVCSPGSPVKHEVTHHIETTGSTKTLGSRTPTCCQTGIRSHDAARDNSCLLKCMVITLAYGT